jgi:uncharacterized damage-inducible protein DinB
MSVAKSILLTDIQYSAWATQRLLDACDALTVDEFERNLGASHESIGGTLRHIYDGDRFWLDNLLAGTIPPLSEFGKQGAVRDLPPTAGLETLKTKWTEVWSELRQWLDALPEQELDRDLHCLLSGGTALPVSRWKIVRHMVNHSTLHRGQIVGMLRTLGKTPANNDLFSYYQEVSPAK